MHPAFELIQPSGIFDGTKGVQFRSEVGDVLEGGAKVILVDFKEVSFLDSSGLGALVVAFKAARAAGGKLCLCSISPQVKMLFELTSMDRIFEVFADRSAFEQALS